MKKVLYLSMAFTFLSWTTAKAQANIFASDPKASALSATNDGNFSCTLNVDALELAISASKGFQLNLYYKLTNYFV